MAGPDVIDYVTNSKFEASSEPPESPWLRELVLIGHGIAGIKEAAIKAVTDDKWETACKFGMATAIGLATHRFSRTPGLSAAVSKAALGYMGIACTRDLVANAGEIWNAMNDTFNSSNNWQKNVDTMKRTLGTYAFDSALGLGGLAASKISPKILYETRDFCDYTQTINRLTGSRTRRYCDGTVEKTTYQRNGDRILVKKMGDQTYKSIFRLDGSYTDDTTSPGKLRYISGPRGEGKTIISLAGDGAVLKRESGIATLERPGLPKIIRDYSKGIDLIEVAPGVQFRHPSKIDLFASTPTNPTKASDFKILKLNFGEYPAEYLAKLASDGYKFRPYRTLESVEKYWALAGFGEVDVPLRPGELKISGKGDVESLDKLLNRVGAVVGDGKFYISNPDGSYTVRLLNANARAFVVDIIEECGFKVLKAPSELDLGGKTSRLVSDSVPADPGVRRIQTVPRSLKAPKRLLWGKVDPLAIVQIESSKGRGTGFFASPDKIVTAFHCIGELPGSDRRGQEDFLAYLHKIFLLDGRTVPALVVGINPTRDLAVLRPIYPLRHIPSIPIRKGGTAGAGEVVVHCGFRAQPDSHAGAYFMDVQPGTVHTVPKFPSEYDFLKLTRCHTTAPVFRGMSGGPVLTLDGQVVSINAFKCYLDGDLETVTAFGPNARSIRALLHAVSKKSPNRVRLMDYSSRPLEQLYYGFRRQS